MTIDVEVITAVAILTFAAGLFVRRFARELADATSEAERHACNGCDGCGAAKSATSRVAFMGAKKTK